MSQQVGLYLNPVGQRRVDFQRVCGERFDRLYVADGTEQAAELMAQQHVDLLVIDLERFDRGFDLASLGQLVAGRAGAATLLLCPFASSGWLPALMAFGPVTYAIAPLGDDELCALIDGAAPASRADLGALLADRDRVQAALHGVDSDADEAGVADRLCAALCGMAGVMHASLFLMNDKDDLHLEAQHGSTGLNLVQLLERSDRLMQSPLRHVFPGLLAACSGELALLDAPARTGDPELALTLLDKGVEMIVGVPFGAASSGQELSGAGQTAPVRGAICLVFGQHRQFAAADIAAFGALAQLAGIGLGMARLERHNAALQAELTRVATTDALTGCVNRRHGEHLIGQEIKRARRYRTPVALIGFDIDRFKAINDQFGHPVGDVVLRTVAEATQAALRGSDVLVRSGGQEFQIIAPHTSAIDALKIAEKIRMTIAQTDIPGADRVTVSLGVAQVAEQENADALMVRVDAALARAKRAGRNCVELAMI